MKIIHLVLGKANPNRMNGVNRVVHQLANTQTHLGAAVEVWGIANDLEHTYPERNFITRLFLQHKNKFYLDKKLQAALQAENTETIFHIHGAFIPEFYHVSKILNKRNIQYIFTPHGSYTKAALAKNNWIKKIYFNLFEKQLVKNAKAVQLLGVQAFDYLDEWIKIDHKVLVANGLNLSEIPYEEKPKNNERPVFGFCGRLDAYHKGLDLTLKGFQLLIKDGYDAGLEFIGDGVDREKLLQLTRDLNLEKYVTFHGKKFGNEKFDILKTFDVFLHTSRNEGFPMAVLEAAGMGKACLTSEATNINHYIRDFNAGIALEENTPDSIHIAMKKAIDLKNQNGLATMGQNARKMIEKEFTWTSIARQLMDIYRA